MNNYTKMKNTIYTLVTTLLLVLVFIGCTTTNNNPISIVGEVKPTGLQLLIERDPATIGQVTFTPTAVGVTSFNIYFGDVTEEKPTIVEVGKTVSHTYKHGTWKIRLFAIGANGQATEKTEEITIIFPDPEKLTVTITPDLANKAKIKVKATATNAISYEVYFGENEGEKAKELASGGEVEYTYARVGTYMVRVVAKSNSPNTIEKSESVEITSLEIISTDLNKVDFELSSPTITFENFGDVTTTVIDNQQKSTINTSDKVAESTKPTGAQTWGGSFIHFITPIDFASKKGIKMQVYSPKSGMIVKMKVENGTDDSVFKEVDVTNTKANEWEELTFKFSTIDTSKEYNKVVVFFDFGVAGDDSKYLFDNIELVTLSVPTVPTTKPTTPPMRANGDVISMFSDAYTDVTIDTWRTDWSNGGELTDETIDSNPVKKYANLNFVGIEMTNNPINISVMTHLHIDIWTSNADELKLKLVDFGADGAFQGDDDTEHEITKTSFEKGSWVSLDISLTDFTGLVNKEHIAQMVITTAPSGSVTLYVDNIYFYKAEPPTATTFTTVDFETTSPTRTFTDFGNVATAVIDNPQKSTIDTSDKVVEFTKPANAETWGGATLQFTEVIDFSTKKGIKMMVYSPKSGITVKVKVENADNDKVSKEIDVINTKMNEWELLTFNFSSIDNREYHKVIVFFDFGNAGDGSKYLFDNIELAQVDALTPLGMPTTAPTAPIAPVADVISMFSDAYTDVTVDTWRTEWSNGGVLTDETIASNAVKKYSDLTTVGIETTTTANQINISEMRYLHLDVWTPNATALKIKLVDFGADAAYQGGDDTEHEITKSSPTLNSWVSYDIPLTEFSSMTGRQHIAQLILSATPAGAATIYVDNLYFHRSTVTPPSVMVPTTAPTTPIDRTATDVISMFSDAYSDVTVDTWRTEWSNGGVLTDETIASNAVKKYSDLTTVGIETTMATSQLNITEMTHFHIDVWTSNATEVKIKLVDYGADAAYQGGDDTEHEVTKSSPTLNTWVSYDIQLTDFTGLTGRNHIAQLILSAAPAGTATIYVDNIYFYKGTVVPPVMSTFTSVDFETTSPTRTLTDFGGITTAIIDNPQKSTIDTSDKVAASTKPTTAETWGGTTLQFTEAIDFSTKKGIKMMLYSPKLGVTVRMKIENAGDGTKFHEIDIVNTKANEWEQLGFDFSSINTANEYHKVSVFFDFNAAGDDSQYLFDNIEHVLVSALPTLAMPTTAPTTPMTRTDTDVISMFSDAYTDVTVDTWRTEWSNGGVLTDETIASNAVKKYSGVKFVGIETTTAANQLNISEMTHFHIDVWTPNATEFKIKLVDFGSDGVFEGTGADTEHEVVKTGLAKGTWVSYDIPLTEFTGLTSKAHIAQLVLSAAPLGSAVIYVDNIYFYKGTVIPPVMTTFTIVDFEDTSPTRTFTDFDGVTTAVIDNPQKSTIDTSDKVAASTKTTGTQTTGGTILQFTEAIDFSTKKGIKLMVYSPKSGMTVKLKVEHATDPTISKELEIDNTVANAWEELTFNFSDIIDTRDYSKIVVFFDFGVAGDGTRYLFDNIELVQVAATPPPSVMVPTTAPTTPIDRTATDVISMFSDAYSDVTVDTWRTDWSNGGVLTDETIASNAVKKYSDLTTVGIETTMATSQLNITEMTHFHIDVWTSNATEVKIKLVDYGADAAYQGGDDTEHEVTKSSPTLNTWVSYDIQLTDFTGLTGRNHIAQLILSAAPAGTATIYVDNIYFYKGTVIPPVMSTFSSVDFETTSPTRTLTDFGGITTAIIDNPQKSTIDTSDKVAASTKPTTAETWGGTTLQFTEAIDFSTKKGIKMMLYSPKSGVTVRMKIENAGDGTKFYEIDIVNTKANEWEQLGFDFSSINTANEYHKVSVFFDYIAAGDGSQYLFDNIEHVLVSTLPTLALPTTAPTTPMARTATDVISMFSDAYTDVTVDTWRAEWSKGGVLTDETIASNAVKKYSGVQFVGIETTTAANQLNISEMTHFHIDVWTPNATEFKIKLVDFGSDGVYQGTGADTEHEVVKTGLAKGTWVSYDIQLTEFTGLTSKAHIAQLVLSAAPLGSAVIYVDNIYFYKGTVIPPVMTTFTRVDFEDTSPTRTFTDFDGVTTAVIDNPQKSTIDTSDKVAASTKTVGTQTTGGTIIQFTEAIDFSTKKGIKLMVYSPKSPMTVNLKVEHATDPRISKELDITNTVANAWVELTFNFSDIIDTRDYSKIVVFFDFGVAGDGTRYLFDNIELVQVAATPPPSVMVPTTAPTTPIDRTATDVISMFSDAYSDVTVDTWRTDWSNGGVLTDETIASNAVKKYSDLTTVGIETTMATSQLNITEMTHFHIDVWTSNATEVKIKLVDYGADAAYQGGDDTEHEVTKSSPTLNTWVSYDIQLTDFTGLTGRNHIAQLILSAVPAGTATIYVDNIYFYKGTVVPPVMSTFSSVDFETTSPTRTLTDFGGITTAIIDNPQKSTIDTSDKVAASTKPTTAETWGGTTLQFTEAIDFSTKKGIKMMLYSPKSGVTVRMKIENAGDGTKLHEIDIVNTKANEWEQLGFDFSSINTANEYHKVSVFFDYNAAGDGSQYLFDNIEHVLVSALPTLAMPTTAPTTPMARTATDVISMFSDAYADVTVDTWRTEWSSGGVLTDETIASNAVKKYSGVKFVGIETTTAANQLNISEMTHIHIDVWSPNATEFKIKLVDFGSDGVFEGTGADTEHEVVKTGLAKGTWVSYDIPLTEFTGLTSKAHIAQLVLSAAPLGSAVIYVDNIYFYK